MAAGDLCTVEDLAAQYQLPESDEELLAALISAASRALCLHPRVQRELAPKTESATRVFRVTGRLVDLAPYDLRQATSVTLHPEGDAVTLAANAGYALDPPGGSLGGSYQRIRIARDVDLRSDFAGRFGYAQLSVAGAWGIWDTAEVPGDVRRACALTVASWVDSGADRHADVDDLVPTGPDRPVTYAVPTAALQLLAPYARVGVA